MKMDRDFYIPKGATKVADKASDAVAYIYSRAGAPYGLAFVGKQSKPIWHHRFTSETRRAVRIAETFEGRRKSLETKAEWRAKRKRPHNLEVGHILKASWGYDQTNVDWYEVTAVVGPYTVEIREIGALDASNGNDPWMTGKSIPAIGQYKSEPMRKRVKWGDSVQVDSVRLASVWSGKPASWTAYA